MKAWRVSIARAMFVVAVLGLGLAALAKPSEIASKAAFTVALASVGVAIVGVIQARGPRRAGWSGYLISGGGYLAVCFAPWFAESVKPFLITSGWIEAAYDRLSYAPTEDGERLWVVMGNSEYVRGAYTPNQVALAPNLAGRPGFLILIEKGGGWNAFPPGDLRAFGPEVMQRLGHSLGAVLIGLIGAVLARWLDARERRAGEVSSLGVDPPIEASP